MPVTIPPDVLRETARCMVDFRDYWQDELPTQIHSRDVADDGSPQWHPDFRNWLGVDYNGSRSDQRWAENPEPRLRITRAFRKLRKKAVREFEVCYRIIVLGDTFEGACTWLNERAHRNAIPIPEGKLVNYDMTDTLLLVVSGVQKLAVWF